MPSNLNIPFVKASGCGNDFLLIDSLYAPQGAAARAELSRTLCDRRNGMGADGVEWMFPEVGSKDESDIRVVLINSDGSEAEVSGNGTRCVAALLTDQRNLTQVRVRTAAGIKNCILTVRHGNEFEFEVAMGKPMIHEILALAISGSPDDADVQGIPLSMGNPQFVVFVEEFCAGWQARAALIQAQPNFVDGVNVDLVRILDRHTVESRFFERGAGETQSSGTGSCASAVAAITTGHCDSPVQVIAPGGSQAVRWEDEVYLRGPAQLIVRGEFFLPEARP